MRVNRRLVLDCRGGEWEDCEEMFCRQHLGNKIGGWVGMRWWCKSINPRVRFIQLQNWALSLTDLVSFSCLIWKMEVMAPITWEQQGDEVGNEWNIPVPQLPVHSGVLVTLRVSLVTLSPAEPARSLEPLLEGRGLRMGDSLGLEDSDFPGKSVVGYAVITIIEVLKQTLP